MRRTIVDYSEDSTQPASANSSVCEGPTSPLIIDNTLNSMEAEAKHSQEVESLKRLLQEVNFTRKIYVTHGAGSVLGESKFKNYEKNLKKRMSALERIRTHIIFLCFRFISSVDSKFFIYKKCLKNFLYKI